MHFDPHAVPGRMGKVSAITGLFEHLTPCFIHFAGFSARPHSLNRGKLRVPDSLIHLPVRSGSATHVHSAGHIRTISGEYNTVIQDYKSAGRDGRSRGASVRQGGTQPGGHNSVE